ncbi:MAG: hypothetical protein N2515_02450 [Deltaproteobacteria bacterium]|nr:hypothetical protein [Deltaproteobacteria bacterium]
MVWSLTLGFSQTAFAGDIEDFQAARAFYEAHEWARAASAFEMLVGSDPPRLSSQPLILEARKYLAASYVFLGREALAAAQFERLLTEEPTYELDPAAFPSDVVRLFEGVRARLLERKRAEELRRTLEAEIERLRAEKAKLEAALSEERSVIVPRARWVAWLPFGIGQFENGNDGWGWFFFVGELLSTAFLGASLALHHAYLAELEDLERHGRDLERIEQVNGALRVLQVVNWSSAGIFGSLVIAGIVEANLSFSEHRVMRLPPYRPPPSWMDVEPLRLRLLF